VSAADDPVIAGLRRQVEEIDREILAAVNRRIQLVARLKREKDDRGIGFLDPQREAWLHGELLRANEGPLSREGVEELLAAILALTKDEVARLNA
jgi:chorismate mutase